MKPTIRFLAKWLGRGVLWTSAILFLSLGALWIRAAFFVSDSFEIRCFGNSKIWTIQLRTARSGCHLQFTKYNYFKNGENEGEVVSLTPQDMKIVFASIINQWWEHYDYSWTPRPYDPENWSPRPTWSAYGMNHEGSVTFKWNGGMFDSFSAWGKREGIARLNAVEGRIVYLAIRYWILMVLFGAMPLFKLTLWIIRRRKPKPGYCAKCGYDLRVHAVGQKCPECGKEIGETEAGINQVDTGGGI